MIKPRKKIVVHYIQDENEKNKKNEAKLDHIYRGTQICQNQKFFILTSIKKEMGEKDLQR